MIPALYTRQKPNKAGTLVHQIKMLVPKPDKLSVIPGTHRVEGKKQYPQVVL